MYSPKDETTRARMEEALAHAAGRLSTTPTGAPAWGWLGRTIGSRTENGHWLRVHCGEASKTPATRNEGIAPAEERVSDKVSRPHLHDLYRWDGGAYVFEAELIDYIAQPVISPETPDLTEDPDLPDSWWATLRESLDALSAAEPPRETIRQSWADRVFPEFLGIPTPAITERITGHADLQWANLTHDPLVILDWERWGAVPVGYDPAMLYVNSLRVPTVADRIRVEFAHVPRRPDRRTDRPRRDAPGRRPRLVRRAGPAPAPACGAADRGSPSRLHARPLDRLTDAPFGPQHRLLTLGPFRFNSRPLEIRLLMRRVLFRSDCEYE